MTKEKRASWSGSLAFVLAASASAVGLGNLWRFPYLAAKYGGGVFIAVYLALSLTLGFTLLVTEISLGRYSRQSQLTAFRQLGHPGWNFLGVMATVVPLFILPYYNVIGGWVVKYFIAYVKMVAGGGGMGDPKAFFDSFVAADWDPFACMAIFTVVTCAVILVGVKNGIEKANLVMMPVLLVMACGIAVYVATLPGSAAGSDSVRILTDRATLPVAGAVLCELVSGKVVLCEYAVSSLNLTSECARECGEGQSVCIALLNNLQSGVAIHLTTCLHVLRLCLATLEVSSDENIFARV